MNLNALIVDDDTKLLTILKSLLTEEKLEVTTSDNGLDAINKCKEQQFDLIISDLMMPGASGLEVLKEARKVSPATLVILVTGFASLETAIEAIREGAYDYITKPFKLDEIKIVVNNAKEKIYLVRENERLFKELQDAYHQLHMVKKIMGAHNDDDMDGSAPDRTLRKNEPLIAGSMLPYHYTGNRRAHSLLLTDLERISILRERGFLSEEEFNVCKSKLFTPLKQ